jgi:hypothetical protein
MVEPVEAGAQSQEPEEGSGAQPETGADAPSRSRIVFPYAPLKDAEQIASVIHDNFGSEATPEQIAAVMEASPRSGAFRNKVSAARIFGAVSVSRGRIALTPLGHRLIDPAQQRQARIDAFFNVPLFKALYEGYKTTRLPRNQAQEAEIERLGVPVKQVERARWTFQKSAETAGFFDNNRTRLTLPGVARDPNGDENPPGDRGGTNGSGDDTFSPPLRALLLTLIKDGAEWSPEETHAFVSAARQLHRPS